MLPVTLYCIDELDALYFVALISVEARRVANLGRATVAVPRFLGLRGLLKQRMSRESFSVSAMWSCFSVERLQISCQAVLVAFSLSKRMCTPVNDAS